MCSFGICHSHSPRSRILATGKKGERVRQREGERLMRERKERQRHREKGVQGRAGQGGARQSREVRTERRAAREKVLTIMTTTRGQAQQLYSVWAMAPAAHPGLQPATELLQRRCGGPKFEAHVTVLGGAGPASADDAAAALHTLARSLPPITYRIRGVGRGATYYQSVFLTVDPTPQVMDANARAMQVFKPTETEKTAYYPHLSLLYADLSDQQKEEARRLAEEQFGPALIGSEFVASSLSLWATDPEDKALITWEKVAEFPLQGSVR